MFRREEGQRQQQRAHHANGHVQHGQCVNGRRGHVERIPVHDAERERALGLGLVRDLLDRAFPGSTQKLVMQALTEKPASRDELAEIRALIDSLEDDAEGGA